jgi:hypothetical protein
LAKMRCSPMSPLVPSPLAGEGTMVRPQSRMGEGFAPTHPSPITARGNIEPPSPARGEGTITATAFALRLTKKDARERAFAAARAGWSDPCIFLFFCRFGIFHPRSHDLKHTHPLVPAAHILRPGFAPFASLTPNRGVGGAPRNVRVLGGTPVGHAILRQRRA